MRQIGLESTTHSDKLEGSSEGIFCYSLAVLASLVMVYMHQLLMLVTGNYQLTSVIAFVVTMAVIILFAWAFNSLVEKNIGKILKKIFG